MLMNSSNRLLKTSVLLLAGLLAACNSPEFSEQPPTEGSLLVTDVSIVLPEFNEILPPRDILIENGKITEVATPQTILPSRAENHLPAEDLYALPGLIDVHVHLGDGGLGEQSDADREGALAQLLRYGVTSIFVPGGGGGNDHQLNRWKERCRSGELFCPNLFGSGALLTAPGSHPIGTIWNLSDATDPEVIYERGAELIAEGQDIEQALDRKVEMNIDAIKIVIEDWGGEVPRLSNLQVERLTQAAHERNLRVFAHVSLKQHAVDAVRAKVDGLMHSVEEPIPDDILGEMSRYGIYYVATLALYDGFFDRARGLNSPEPYAVKGSSPRALASLDDLPELPFSAEEAELIEEAVMENLRRAATAGVPLALGSDVNNPLVFPGYSAHEELELMVEAGLTASEALAAATLGGAAFLSQESKLGKIAPGYQADLLIVKKNPLEEIKNTRSIHSVIRAGRLVDNVVSH